MNILLVEDNREMSQLIEKLIERNHYLVSSVFSLEEAEEAVMMFNFDLVILDRCLGDKEGLDLIDFCMRKRRPNRFLILSALDEAAERIFGLEAGALDYLIKPFEPQELMARIRIALNYPKVEQTHFDSLGDLTYDASLRTFLVKGQPFELRRRESLLLEALISRQKRIVPRELLHDAIFGVSSFTSEVMLAPHISRLRKKLDSAGARVKIRTHSGVGYSLELEH